ncbi:MAG TPA: hypothetical protein VKT00_03165 [Casimicrobiaceae bacterium]|nr:hypothetical protein [Casimicrobiaceae bacterium]
MANNRNRALHLAPEHGFAPILVLWRGLIVLSPVCPLRALFGIEHLRKMKRDAGVIDTLRGCMVRTRLSEDDPPHHPTERP